jgi:hypothetical protein
MSRFLDVTKVFETLDAPATDDDEKALVAAIKAEGKLEQQLRASKGKEILSNELQQRLIIATTKAAAARVAADPQLGPKVQAAIDAVVASGGTKEDGLALVHQSVLDEAFAWADAPDEFNATLLGATLESIVALASVETDAVEAWVDEFVKQVDAKERPLRVAVADALLEASWSDGPQPIAPEHVDDAMDSLSRTVASNELEKAGAALIAFLTFLGAKKLLGTQRLSRLSDVARAAATAPEMTEEEDDDWGGEDEEE